MNEKTLPVSAARLEEIIAEYPTPFHIYDAKGIVDNIRRFIKAFSWAKAVSYTHLTLPTKA